MPSNSISPVRTDPYQNLVSPRPYTVMLKWATHPNSGPFTLYTMAPCEEEDRWLGDYIWSLLTPVSSGSCVTSSMVTNSNSVEIKEEL